MFLLRGFSIHHMDNPIEQLHRSMQKGFLLRLGQDLDQPLMAIQAQEEGLEIVTRANLI